MQANTRLYYTTQLVLLVLPTDYLTKIKKKLKRTKSTVTTVVKTSTPTQALLITAPLQTNRSRVAEYQEVDELAYINRAVQGTSQ